MKLLRTMPSVRAFRRHLSALAAAAALTLALGAGCERYEPPPLVMVDGLTQGVLSDSRAPLVLRFGMPVVPETLSVKVALEGTDVEGNLFDEDADPDTELDVLVAHDPVDGDRAARAELTDDGATLILTPEAALPVGPKLVLIVEAGLRSRGGTVARHRQRISFSYTVTCDADAPTTLQGGVYYVLLDVREPLGSQIQLYGALDVDAATGKLVGQFTNADRNPAQTCPTSCTSAEVCRLLPAPECVAPSTRAGTPDEYPDFIPNATPPTGYSFFVQGCVVDRDGKSGVLTAPATMVVESPRVTVEALTMTAEFAADEAGVVRATGSLVADTVRLGNNPLGPGKGTMLAVRIPDDRVPAGVPRPPPPAGNPTDGGVVDAGR